MHINRPFLAWGIIILLIATTAPQTSGQKRRNAPPSCSLRIDKSPTIRGLQLGMSLEQMLRLVPNVRKGPVNQDEALGKVGYNVKVEGTIFEDVWITASYFVDGKLSYLGITYPDYEPTSGDDFIRQASKTLSLPQTGWRRESESSRKLTCQGFEVYLFTGKEGFKQNYPGIVLIDTVAEALVEYRKKERIRNEQERRKAEQQRRRVFRP